MDIIRNNYPEWGITDPKDKYCMFSLKLLCTFNKLKELKTQRVKETDLNRKFPIEEKND